MILTILNSVIPFYSYVLPISITIVPFSNILWSFLNYVIAILKTMLSIYLEYHYVLFDNVVYTQDATIFYNNYCVVLFIISMCYCNVIILLECYVVLF